MLDSRYWSLGYHGDVASPLKTCLNMTFLELPSCNIWIDQYGADPRPVLKELDLTLFFGSPYRPELNAELRFP